MICGTEFVLIDIDQAWPAIKSRLRRTRSDSATLSSIRMRCREGEALCLSGPDGVVIVAPEVQLDGTIVAKVLLAVSLDGAAGAFDRQEEAMLRIARDLGATVLAFKTDRNGWVRVLGPEWMHRSGVFSRSV